MDGLTLDQVIAETGLCRTQINRFVRVGALVKGSDGLIHRDSVDRLKRCYMLPPKRSEISDTAYRGYRR